MDHNAKKVKYFQRIVLAWYQKDGRHFPWRNKSATQYQRIVSEVLLQRTKAETVSNYFYSFIKKYPSWKTLAQSTEEDLGLFLRPLGLWKRRASSLLRLALDISKKNGRFPKQREEIEQLPNVGQYISNAILLFCHGHPQPLLDVNMARILERVFGARKLADIRYDPYIQQLAMRIVQCKTPVKMNWAILDLASTICMLKNPRCEICPVTTICTWVNE